MPFKITFHPNGKWAGGTMIPPELRDITDLSQWIKSFIEKFKNMGKLYRKFYLNDGELVGQEKASLVFELDGFIGGLLVLRRCLSKEQPSEYSSLKGKYFYNFTFHMDTINWRGTGWFSNQYIFSITNFVDWYNNRMMKKLMTLFKMYAEAMADNILTDEERERLIIFVETIIFDILVIERVLITGNIKQ